MADEREFRAIARVDGEGGETVVAAVGDVDESPRWMDFDIGGGLLLARIAFGWQRRLGFGFREGASARIEMIRGDAAALFVTTVSDVAVWVEPKVARAAVGFAF